MAEKIEVEEMRETFHRVATYRAVCDSVRAGANHTLFNGVFFLGLTAVFYNIGGKSPLLLAYAAIGVGEILVGLWQKFAPTPEGVLVDSLLQFVFVALIGIRQLVLVQAGNNPHPISLIIGAWVLFDAVRRLQSYLQLRRMFVERPTAEHIAYVNELIGEIRDSDPETDTLALDLPTRPHLKAKLLGDLAILVEERGGAVQAVARKDFEINRVEDSAGESPTGYLSIDGHGAPAFELSAATWRNYARWKTEGGEPPPPVKVRPVGGRPSDD